MTVEVVEEAMVPEDTVAKAKQLPDPVGYKFCALFLSSQAGSMARVSCAPMRLWTRRSWPRLCCLF